MNLLASIFKRCRLCLIMQHMNCKGADGVTIRRKQKRRPTASSATLIIILNIETNTVYTRGELSTS